MLNGVRNLVLVFKKSVTWVIWATVAHEITPVVHGSQGV
jgi:hypothetical protein